MFRLNSIIALFLIIAVASTAGTGGSFPSPQRQLRSGVGNPHPEPYRPRTPEELREGGYNPLIVNHQRFVRAPRDDNLPDLGSNGQGDNKRWKVEPEIRRQDGATRGKVRVQHEGNKHRIEAEYEKKFGGRGPSENWHVGGTFDW